MAAVALLGVNVLNNPAKFTDKYELEITFECYEDNLQKGLSFKRISYTVLSVTHSNYSKTDTCTLFRFGVETDLCWVCYKVSLSSFPALYHLIFCTRKCIALLLIYIQLSSSDQYDQELDSLLVGPIPRGVNKFVFEADPPDTKRIPDAEVLGVTVVLLTCSYDGREFVRVGYYVNNEYDNEEMSADPPAKPIIERIGRNVLAEKPRVTRFAIKWYVSTSMLPLLSHTIPRYQYPTWSNYLQKIDRYL